MAKTITGEQLRAAVDAQSFIKGGDRSSAEGVKYDFRIGTRVLKASVGQPIEMLSIPEQDRFVEPGEVVFVLTEERLDLPRNMIAILSQKRKLSHQGIQVLGGFCVDPLYRGRLLVGLYNFSSRRFPHLFQAGNSSRRCFMSWTSKKLGTFQRPKLHLLIFGALFVAIVLLLPGGLVEVATRLRQLPRRVARQRS